MKKIIFLIATIALVGVFCSCDPVENRTDITGDGGGTIVKDASELDVTIGDLYGENGYLNKIQVRCKSSVSCQWTDGIETIVKNSGEFVFTFSGDQTLTLTALTADGRILTKDIPVNGVKAPLAPPVYGFLFGYTNSVDDAVKTWVWSTNWNVPDGGPVGPIIMAGDPVNDRQYWGWNPSPADLSAECLSHGYPDEGTGAKMVFSLKGKKITKYDHTGKVIGEGSISWDLTPNAIYGSIGTFTFSGTNILYPYDRNAGSAPWTTSTFTLIALDNDHLMFFIKGSCGWYYVFNREGWQP